MARGNQSRRRWGVVFWRLLAREADWLPPWQDLLRCWRFLKARGEIRGGRFVAGFSGETLLSLSGADLLNLVGLVTPDRRLPRSGVRKTRWCAAKSRRRWRISRRRAQVL